MSWKIAIVLLAAGLSAAVLQSSANLPPEWRAGSALATPEPPGRLVAAGGVVEPASEARQVEAAFVGRLLAVNVEEGDRVSAGETIAEIENADLKAELAGAEAALVARQNELARLKAGARVQEIDQAKAALRESEAAALVARSNYQRQHALGARNIASAEQVDRALADRDTSEARRALMAAKLALLIAPPRTEDAAIAAANVDAARAHADEIRAEIAKTIISSPVDGRILKLFRHMGETVTNLPPTPIATIGDTGRLRVRADVDQADISDVGVGQTVWITADAFAGRRFRGRVERIAAQLGRKNFYSDSPSERVDTKILEVLIDLDPDPRLPIGLPVDVVFEKRRTDIASTPNAPPAPSPAKPEMHPAEAQQPVLPAISPAQPAATDEQSAMVQIGAYHSGEAAQSAWTGFTARHSELVQGMVPDIQMADLGKKGVWYRLRFGPVSNAAAGAVCDLLKGQAIGCFVAAR